MRIIGGIWGGRRLATPKRLGGGSHSRSRPALRPTSDKAREAIFNILYSLGLPAGASVVDAYCGTGSLGIEALSRAAAHVTFIDSDPTSVESVRASLDGFGADPASFTLLSSDALFALRNKVATPDLLLADPPYGEGPFAELLAIGAGVVVAEADHFIEPDPALGYEQLRARRYGKAHITVLRYIHPMRRQP